MGGQRVRIWPIRFALVVALTALFGLAGVRAQTANSVSPVPGADAALIEDIVTGSRVLADFGVTDMLVRDAAIGKALALTLGDKPVVLMRGHGDVTVGPSVKLAVFRAYYTDVNARLQSQAIALGGEPSYLTPGEGTKADAVNLAIIDRIWSLWKIRVPTTPAK